MSFLSLVLALLVERYLRLGYELRHYGWFSRYRAWLAGVLGGQGWYPSWIGLVVLLFLPALSLEWGLLLLSGRWLNLPVLVVATVVLLYCLGPESLWQSLRRYFDDGEREDWQGAYHHVADRVCSECALSPERLGREVSEWILREANRRWFAVLFWFLVLGPAGALLYRMMRLYRSELEDTASHREPLDYLLRLADWIPARLSAFCYALSGDFVGAWKACKRHATSGLDSSDCVLAEAGIGALNLGENRRERILAENRDALALVERSLIVQVVILSLCSVLGVVLW